MRILGLNITRTRERKESPVWPSMLTYLGGSDAVYTPTDYGTLTKAGYQMCAPAYAAVSLIARSAAGVDWVVLKKKRSGSYDEVEEHPLVDLLATPNENEDGYRLVESIVSYKLLAGNSYVLMVQGTKDRPPRYLYTLRPDRMKALPGDAKRLIGGYRYTLNGVKTNFSPSEVLHLRDFHPLHDFYGLSRLEVAAKSIDISNWSEEWNLKSLQNDMRLSGLLKLVGLSEEKSAEFRRQLTEKHAGAGNAGKTLVLENATEAEFTPMSMTPKDADWSESDKRNLRRICSIFNIWSGLLGDHENQTYANMSEGRKALYVEAVLPELDGLKSAFNRWLVPLFGEDLYLDYDRDHIEALQEDRGAKYTYLGTADFLTINEKRDACGYDEVEGGDVIMTSFSRIPLGEISRAVYLNPAGEGDGEPEDDESDDEGKRRKVRAIKAVPKSFWTAPERKERLWKAFEGRVVVRQRKFASLAEKYLDRQWRELKTKIGKLASLGHASARSLFDVDAETAKYAKTFGGWYEDNFVRAGNAGMRAAKGELFDDGEWKADDQKPKPTSWVFDATEEEIEALHDMIFNSGTKVNEATLKVVEAAIKRANAENMTVEEFAQDIWREVADFDPWRARLWARTESARVDNFGQVEGYKQTEFIERKGWMCSFVPDSRQEHIDADGREVPLDEPFVVGGDLLMFPGDASQTDAGNVANCLCTTYPVVGE